MVQIGLLITRSHLMTRNSLVEKRMETMPQDNLDLAGIFGAVTQALASNQQSLNQSDTHNQDHGDNMVQTFQTITKALQQKKGGSASAALSYASKTLSKSTSSSSGKLYAQNLAQASTQFKGKSIDAQSALSLLQTLIGGGQSNQSGSQPAGGDMLSALLGGLAGGENSPAQAPMQSGGGDLLGMLLGGLTGGADSSDQAPTQSGGGDLLSSLLGGLAGSADSSAQPSNQTGGGDLLGSLLGGLAGGGGGLGALVQTFLGGSGMGDSSHRTQSTQLVINAFLGALSSLKNQ
jgi:hypothetical protein